MAGIFALGGLTLACGESLPSSPTSVPAPPAKAAPPVLRDILPDTGNSSGGTQVTINGSGFQSGTTVNLGGTAAIVTALTSSAITAITRVHAPGTADVVVTNPDGQSASLVNGYTYVADPPPSLVAVSPDRGSADGGSGVKITGTGFQPGARVRVGHADVSAFFSNSTTLFAPTPAHAAGIVDLVVTNPDGQSGTLTAAFTYARPETFDFNGTWKGSADDPLDDHGQIPMGFTIENDTLISVWCGSESVTVSPRPSISGGRFSFSQDDRVVVSGRILTTSVATGTIGIRPCGASWGAVKQ